jgi:glycosyltransferase involved in cell wall biosynthesis
MSKKEPYISVLMCVYNGETYLNEAIDSILNQSYSNFEFVIINDGSTDKTEEIILSYKDKRIKYYKNEKNLKLIASLNKGLEICSGKYIVRMDADDIALPHRIETQMDFLKNHPDAGAVGSFVETIGLNENYVIKFKTSPEKIKFELFFRNHLFHPTVTINSHILKQNNLKYKNYLHAEDYKLWIDLSRKSNLYIIPEILLYYRLHGENISITNTGFQEEISKRIRKDQFDELNIELNNTEERLYNSWLTGKVKFNSDELEIILKLFDSIVQSNNITRIFDHNILANYFCEKAWGLACLNTALGLSTFNSFKRKKSFQAPTYFLGLKLFLKCLFRISYS